MDSVHLYCPMATFLSRRIQGIEDGWSGIAVIPSGRQDESLALSVNIAGQQRRVEDLKPPRSPWASCLLEWSTCRQRVAVAEWAAFASLCTGLARHAVAAVKNQPRPASPGLGAAPRNGKFSSRVQLSGSTRHLISVAPCRPELSYRVGGGWYEIETFDFSNRKIMICNARLQHATLFP